MERERTSWLFVFEECRVKSCYTRCLRLRLLSEASAKWRAVEVGVERRVVGGGYSTTTFKAMCGGVRQTYRYI